MLRSTAHPAAFGVAFAVAALVLIAVLLPLAAIAGEAASVLLQDWVRQAAALTSPI